MDGTISGLILRYKLLIFFAVFLLFFGGVAVVGMRIQEDMQLPQSKGIGGDLSHQTFTVTHLGSPCLP